MNPTEQDVNQFPGKAQRQAGKGTSKAKVPHVHSFPLWLSII